MKMIFYLKIIAFKLFLFFIFVSIAQAQYPQFTKPVISGQDIREFGLLAKFKPEIFTDEILTNVFFYQSRNIKQQTIYGGVS